MTLAQLSVVAIGVYLALVVGVAERARRARRDQSPADHYLAGRTLGPVVLFFTLYATAYSGNSLLGYPGEAYRQGFAWIMSPGFMLAIVVSFHWLVPRIRPVAVARGFVTPGDWVRYRYGADPGGAALQRAVAAVMTIALANYLLAQLTAMGLVAQEATGGQIPYAAGVVGLAAMILVYETLGGMRAVAWTDAFQGALMLLGLGFLLGWLVLDSGGLGAMTLRVAEMRPDAVAVPDAAVCANWVSAVVLVGLAGVVYPQALQRIFAGRDAGSLRRALAAMSFMPLATTGVVALIGIAAIARLEGLDGVEADNVMPRLLGLWSEAGPGATAIAVGIVVGALAAIMSTADSVILTLSSLVAGDLLGRPRNDPATTRVGKFLAVAIMFAMVVLALLPRLSLWRLIELKMELLVQCAPAFVLGLHWQRARAPAVLAGLGVGAAIATAAALGGWPRIGGVHLGLVALVCNAAICAIVTWWRDDRGTRGGSG